LCLLAVLLLLIAIFGWNWARGPLQDATLQRTGRALHIGGDLSLALGWPAPHLLARDVSFANPGWASAPQMVRAEAVDISFSVPELLRGRLLFPSVRLTRPQVFLEQAAGGRKTWLLDRLQTDESQRALIGTLSLDQGELDYIHTERKTHVHALMSTSAAPADRRLSFTLSGSWQGQPLQGSGSGADALAWRDESVPYPLQIQLKVGDTEIHAQGSVTSLQSLAAVDLQLDLRGRSLAGLFPVIGLALPPTPAYSSSGHLVRSGAVWRYEAFEARIGQSDLRGNLAVDTSGARQRLSGALSSKQLSLADLRPVVGARPARSASAPAVDVDLVVAAAAAKPAKAAVTRLLPDLPLETERWGSLDADVTLHAQALLHAGTVPLNNLDVHIVLLDRQMSLKPLSFDLAGGKLSAQIVLDSRQQPLRGQAHATLRGMKLQSLLPAAAAGKASIGLVNGEFDVSGQGASVGRMLAGANGRISLVAQNGQISRLLMEQAGLHLLEILQLKLTGDETVALNCAVADFSIQAGVMQARALVLDTTVNTLVGDGQVNLAQERLNLRLVPRTKVSSIVALRGPVYITGSFLRPQVTLDGARIATRGAGALLLGLLNPLLALIPLFEAGPGADSPCGRLVRQAQARPPANTPPAK
jgi:AsmA protein